MVGFGDSGFVGIMEKKMETTIQGLGFRVWGLWFRVWGLGFRVLD